MYPSCSLDLYSAPQVHSQSWHSRHEGIARESNLFRKHKAAYETWMSKFRVSAYFVIYPLSPLLSQPPEVVKEGVLVVTITNTDRSRNSLSLPNYIVRSLAICGPWTKHITIIHHGKRALLSWWHFFFFLPCLLSVGATPYDRHYNDAMLWRLAQQRGQSQCWQLLDESGEGNKDLSSNTTQWHVDRRQLTSVRHKMTMPTRVFSIMMSDLWVL